MGIKSILRDTLASQQQTKNSVEELNVKVLNDLNDVNILTPVDGQVLKYDANNELWKAGGGHTIVSHDDTTATGAELETLTDGSETALHSHAAIGSPDGDSPVTVDSESNTLAENHAYLAQTAGFVIAYYAGGYITTMLSGFVGPSGPKENGIEIGRSKVAASAVPFISFFVGNGKYFEITFAVTARIIWTPFVTGGGAPIDQD